MTKRAMVDRMVELGVYNEADRNYILRKYTKEQLEERYNEYVPFRITYLKKQGVDIK